MSKVTLVIMAAGIGSRFGGGIKQLEPVGPSGEIIMDYSIYDAMEAGFNKVVFVIRKDLEKDFNDEPHLNHWGSCKFTDYLGNYLSSFDSISDKRGQEGYQSWNDHVEMIDQEFYDHQDAR